MATHTRVDDGLRKPLRASLGHGRTATVSKVRVVGVSATHRVSSIS